MSPTPLERFSGTAGKRETRLALQIAQRASKAEWIGSGFLPQASDAWPSRLKFLSFQPDQCLDWPAQTEPDRQSRESHTHHRPHRDDEQTVRPFAIPVAKRFDCTREEVLSMRNQGRGSLPNQASSQQTPVGRASSVMRVTYHPNYSEFRCDPLRLTINGVSIGFHEQRLHPIDDTGPFLDDSESRGYFFITSLVADRRS